jgi:hypothetical protein
MNYGLAYRRNAPIVLLLLCLTPAYAEEQGLSSYCFNSEASMASVASRQDLGRRPHVPLHPNRPDFVPAQHRAATT